MLRKGRRVVRNGLQLGCGELDRSGVQLLELGDLPRGCCRRRRRGPAAVVVWTEVVSRSSSRMASCRQVVQFEDRSGPTDMTWARTVEAAFGAPLFSNDSLRSGAWRAPRPRPTGARRTSGDPARGLQPASWAEKVTK